MEIKQLRHLVVLCEELNFARAASRLGITEPALRMSLASLERELGTALLTRNPVSPTQFGQQAVSRARRAVTLYDRLTTLRQSPGPVIPAT